MMSNEPKVEFVPIDLKENMVTEGSFIPCTDSVTDGGTYCIDSYATSDCGTPMRTTGE